MPMYATSSAHHALRYLMKPATSGEGVSYSSSSLCFCICSLLGPDIFPESCSRTFSAWDFTQCDKPSSTPIQNITQYNYYLIFEVLDGATEYSEQNVSTCFLNLICSYFFRTCNFDLPVSFSGTSPTSHFQTICLLSLRRNSVPQSVVKSRTQNHTCFSRHLFLYHSP